MPINLFGWEMRRANPADDEKQNRPSFVTPTNDDGSLVVSAEAMYGIILDLEGTVRTEAELVNKYRDMELYPDVDSAIDDIVNEAIATDEEDVVAVNLDGFEKESPFADKAIQEKIEAEFKKVVELLDFNNKAYDIFRRWYVDGRIYYNVIIDEKDTAAGIKELRFIDPRKIRRVREVKREVDRQSGVVLQQVKGEYYVYAELGFSPDPTSVTAAGTPTMVAYGNQAATAGLRIAKDTVIHVTSGLTDKSGNLVLSYLHKAIKPLNQLKALEDSMVIYRFTRAPERLVFYIDTGNLPKIKSEQYIKDLQTKFKNRLNYDSATGEIRDDRKFMSMLENYWLGRREGSKGTEIEKLEGGNMMSQLDDVNYFQQKLYRALGVPISRLVPEQTGFGFGKGAEISRDEIKFAKFVDRIRRRFSILFFEALIKQLKLKNIIGPDDETEFYRGAWFEFNDDSHWVEQKNNAILSARIEVAKDIQDFVGKYFSHEFVRKKIFRQTDDEIKAEDDLIKGEKDNPQFKDPIMVGDPTFGGDATNGDPFGGQGAPPGPPGAPPPADPASDPTQQPKKDQLQEYGRINRQKRRRGSMRRAMAEEKFDDQED